MTCPPHRAVQRAGPPAPCSQAVAPWDWLSSPTSLIPPFSLLPYLPTCSCANHQKQTKIRHTPAAEVYLVLRHFLVFFIVFLLVTQPTVTTAFQSNLWPLQTDTANSAPSFVKASCYSTSDSSVFHTEHPLNISILEFSLFFLLYNYWWEILSPLLLLRGWTFEQIMFLVLIYFQNSSPTFSVAAANNKK